jgi:23S rRNA pseudouridine1911/1915/1917 synthase
MTRLRASLATYVRPPDVERNAVVTVLRVPPEAHGQRLDLFVQSQLKQTSRTRAQRIVGLSAYDDRGKRLRSNDRVRAEQRVLLWRAPWDETPVATEIAILYEDDHLLAVDKPAPLPVHPSARHYRNTLIRLLLDARKGAFLSLGHRLDRETSGVILLAKTRACERLLKRQFERRDAIAKSYLAITWGVPSLAKTEGRSFRYERSLELDPTSRLRVKMRPGRTPTALQAATRFEVLSEAHSNGRSYALVRAVLETGRQHQIRVHLADLGSPVVGDKLYGADESLFMRGADQALTPEDLAALELPRHALHAAEVALLHPMTGEQLVICAPLPADLASFWNALIRAENPEGY